MRVLIVDDDITTRISLTGLLRKHDNCEILEAETGIDALQIIQSDYPPDLIFMDWNMPGLSGVEVTNLVRETQKEQQPYVIMVSSYQETDQIIEALNFGADDYITKPIDGHYLRAKFFVAKRIIDIQEKLKQSNEVLKKLAHQDELTGVLNRRAGYASFQVELERCLRKDNLLAVALVDIDHFKRINDQHGHDSGDQVLRLFASTLQKALRPYDVVCRFGGEEFLLLAEIAHAEEAQQLFERVRQRINQTVFDTGSMQMTVTASIGVNVVWPDADLTLQQLTKQADAALYQAKANGRDQVVLYSELGTQQQASLD